METAEAESLAIAEATASSLRQFLAQAEAGLTNASAGLGMEFVTGTPCGNSMQTLANIIPLRFQCHHGRPRWQVAMLRRANPGGGLVGGLGMVLTHGGRPPVFRGRLTAQ